jgi:hypothetical protein
VRVVLGVNPVRDGPRVVIVTYPAPVLLAAAEINVAEDV